MPDIFEMRIAVENQHLDDFGHVNNVIYLQWMQDVAWAHSTRLGLDLAAYQALDTAMVARQHQLTYLAACRLGDSLILSTWLTQNDGFNLHRQYRLIHELDQKVVFEAQTHWVCIRLSTGQPIRMPPRFKQAYALT
ncbi:MAG: acyl-CoA thioesterase [Moraxellaceae bacterium]|nr:MAG: acyl-CoA thioesterase [Moraxellaceae bacterium]